MIVQGDEVPDLFSKEGKGGSKVWGAKLLAQMAKLCLKGGSKTVWEKAASLTVISSFTWRCWSLEWLRFRLQMVHPNGSWHGRLVLRHVHRPDMHPLNVIELKIHPQQLVKIASFLAIVRDRLIIGSKPKLLNDIVGML